MFGHGGGFDGKGRKVLQAVDAVLADGERRDAATVARGLGRGADVGRAVDWVLVATDRRVLLFVLLPGAGATPALVSSFPRGDVLVIDAQLSGAQPTLVVRFPDAEVAWFPPPAAWREQTERLVSALGRVVPYPDNEDDAPDRAADRRS